MINRFITCIFILVRRYSFILGWHALRLCEGRGGCQSNHALRRASERATRTRRIPKLSCIAALAFCVGLCASDSLRADLFLAVDFDINTSGVQSEAVVDANGETTAWIVLFLTGNTDLYAYQFSVRFNSDRLELLTNGKDDTPPTNVNGKSFKENLTIEKSQSGSDQNFANYIEINYFDGEIPDPNGQNLAITRADIDAQNGLVLGALNFKVRGSGDALLIKPGVYDQNAGPGDFRFFDGFRGNDGPIPVTDESFLGGRIVAVPEPSSLILVTVVAGACSIGYFRAITGGTKKQVSS